MESKSISSDIITSAGKTGMEEPPGITAFNLRLLRMPPANANKSLNGVPSGTSKLPGLFTCPVTEKILQPPLFGLPNFKNQSAPRSKITGTDAYVSTLLIVVGLPYNPRAAGKGGLNRGMPFLPSSDSINAVSSPQI